MNESVLVTEYQFVIGRLEEEKGNWPEVAAKSGVPYRTVQKIGSRKTKVPSLSNLEKLAAHFRTDEAA